MKKLLSLFLSISMILSFFSCFQVSAADTYSSNGWTYELKSGVAKIVGYTGDATNITIPSTLDGYIVEDIATYAFEDNTQITSVNFPKTLKKVEYCAFSGCTNLASIYVESGDIEFSYYTNSVFKGCNNLTNVTFANDIDKIPAGICWNLTNLKTIDIPDGVTKIGENAFNNSGITSITLPKYLEEIECKAFENCKGLNSVDFPKYLKKVGYGAFRDCSNLESVTIPKNADFGNLVDGVFSNCSSLNNITFEAGRKYIDQSMFSNCTGLKSIVIPDGVVEIEANAFENCPNLQSVTIPNSVTKISWSVFTDCSSLKNVSIPNNVIEIGDGIFDGCSLLESVQLPNKIKFISDKMFYDCISLKNIAIPESVTEIGGKAFYNCNSLESIELPKNLVRIGNWSNGETFYGCSSLKNIDIPLTVNDIRAGTFSNCTQLEEIVIPYGVEEIKKETFKGCKSLNKVTIPSTVTSIDGTAFTYYGDTTVRCVKNSAADLYAKEYDMPVEYMVEKVDITAATVSGVSNSYNYTGKAITPNVSVNFGDTLLSKNVDYTVSYSNNTNAGTATINITGMGKYEGNLVKTFNIARIDMSKAYISLSETKYTYNQDVKKPSVTIKYNGMTLKNGTDYTLKYANNINAGTGSVAIMGKGNYTGSVEKTFTIGKKSISQTNIKLSDTSYTYNGKTQKPTVTVKLNGIKLKNGTDYSISYKNNKYVGSASVTIKGVGNYIGTVVKTFKINPKNTSLISLSKGNKQITAKWKKQTTQTTGYQVQYSTSKSFKSAKTVTVKKNKTTSTTIKKLKAKKTYYVRVRTYKTVKGKKYCSSWSKVKNVKTK